MQSKTCETPIRWELKSGWTRIVEDNIQSCKSLDRSNLPNCQVTVSMATCLFDFASIVWCTKTKMYIYIVTATGTECIMRVLSIVSPRKSLTCGRRSQWTLWYCGLLYHHKRKSVNQEFWCPPSNLPFNCRSPGFLNGGRALGNAPILSWLDHKLGGRAFPAGACRLWQVN